MDCAAIAAQSFFWHTASTPFYGSNRMIIDCHGHYTTAPNSLEAFRQQQIDGLKNAKFSPAKNSLVIRDDEIREGIEGAQLRIQRERGTNLTIFSPRAGGMGHHIGNASASALWSDICNELIYRVCTLLMH